jgi:predicted ribosome quality control (RQC) complex YloA/Tae2 family protein
VVNSWNRTRYSTTEKSEIFRLGTYLKPVATGYYSWINRPWQRYDYESSLDNALDNLLESISWKQYEQRLDDINKIRKALKKMENYEGAPRN